MKTYSSRQACALAGVSYRQVDYWIRTSVFFPTTQAKGSGSRRSLSADDVVALRVLKHLLDAGVSLDVMRNNHLLRDPSASASYLVVQDGKMFWSDDLSDVALSRAFTVLPIGEYLTEGLK